MHIFSSTHSGTSHRVRDSFKHRLTENIHLHWMCILIMTVLASLILIVIGYKKYWDTTVRLAAPLSSPVLNSSVLFNADELSRILKNFDDRTELRTMLLKGYAGVGDPTL